MNIGQKVLFELKKEISETEYEHYIKKLVYDTKRSKSNISYFNAPNILVSKWIKTKYADRLAHLFELQNKIKPQIEIVVKKQSNEKTISILKSNIEKGHTKSTYLNPSLIFESFIVGESNQFAYTTAKAVAEKPGKIYNPLFIYGGVGLGKTHLLQAIGNYHIALGNMVIYTTLEQFMNSFTSHLRSQTMDRFRDKYRECDLLLIDDIQFLSRKEQTQEEFFHTFNELHNTNKQIVMTADRPPNKIAGLVDRLRTRFEWGMMADIQPPGLETKIAIIQKKCELDGIKLSNEVTNFIATNMGDNIREIESAIIRINAMATMLNQEISLDFAQNAIKDHLKEKRESITIDNIMKVVSHELNVKPSDIRSRKRTSNVVNARRTAIYLARNLTKNSMPQIALYFGMKDHSAISHTMKKIDEIIENDENFKVILEELSNKIYTNTQQSH
ncbi:MAG: chromosomal replication initiator protein DnaA [Sulfurovum sp.]|nr:chromosomal replication initiator protein DnaA [Sulfurovum sp.]MCB4746358.1 chromosomal replication initiator protein DnaA [Sulfurovum sp.]MCB4749943.1 chromosomal replication initiator protein DnaA [Sulfurovum sp.]MCB4751363.1 chromosomal replication initiator protein DnaA [Sulfurovum sp.]MCB4752717.1 chromosomal replication initiator protein DnaA [Sulfurovum sp.]